MANVKDIGKLIAKLSAGYPNFAPNEYTAEIYLEDLQDVPVDLLMTAFQHCRTSTTRDQRFAPSAGEIRQAMAEIKRQTQNIPSGLEAWSELLHVPADEKISSVSDPIEYTEDNRVIVYEKPYEWSHPLVRKVAVMLGFPRFPDWDAESFERTAFLKAYEVELQNYLKQDNQPQQVKNYIADQQDQVLLMAENKIKQLTERLTK